MLLHINPDINLFNAAEDVAQRVSSQLGELGKNLPGYELIHGGVLTDLKRRFADAAVPIIVDLALTASDVMSFEAKSADVTYGADGMPSQGVAPH